MTKLYMSLEAKAMVACALVALGYFGAVAARWQYDAYQHQHVQSLRAYRIGVGVCVEVHYADRSVETTCAVDGETIAVESRTATIIGNNTRIE